MNVYQHIKDCRNSSKKLFAILIDPDKQDKNALLNIIKKAKSAQVDLFLLEAVY